MIWGEKIKKMKYIRNIEIRLSKYQNKFCAIGKKIRKTALPPTKVTEVSDWSPAVVQ